jgi:hypothetical protein
MPSSDLNEATKPGHIDPFWSRRQLYKQEISSKCIENRPAKIFKDGVAQQSSSPKTLTAEPSQ